MVYLQLGFIYSVKDLPPFKGFPNGQIPWPGISVWGKGLITLRIEKEHHPIEKEDHLNQTAIQKLQNLNFPGSKPPYFGFCFFNGDIFYICSTRLFIAHPRLTLNPIHPRNLTARPWKMMVGRWVSFLDWLFLGAMFNFRGVIPGPDWKAWEDPSVLGLHVSFRPLTQPCFVRANESTEIPAPWQSLLFLLGGWCRMVQNFGKLGGGFEAFWMFYPETRGNFPMLTNLLHHQLVSMLELIQSLTFFFNMGKTGETPPTRSDLPGVRMIFGSFGDGKNQQEIYRPP